jgi:hypothetical protein
MKKQYCIVTTLLLLTSNTYADAIQQDQNMPCSKIAQLNASLSQSKHPENILLQMGEQVQKIENLAPLEMEAYQKNPTYKNLCHFKIVISENFGDFPSYSGYHYYQILEKYPKSALADDAAYALIYVITEDTYNFSDTRIEKKKLAQFLHDYPKSNRATEAKARIKEIEVQLQRGESPILD